MSTWLRQRHLIRVLLASTVSAVVCFAIGAAERSGALEAWPQNSAPSYLQTTPTQTVSYTLRVGSVSVHAGEQGSVVVEITDIIGDVAAWDVRVGYDPAVASVVTCNVRSNEVCNTEFTPSSIRLAGATTTSLSGTVELATVEFRCHAVGSTLLTLDWVIGGVPEQAAQVRSQNGRMDCVPAPIATAAVTSESKLAARLPGSGSGTTNSDETKLMWVVDIAVLGVITLAIGALLKRKNA